MQPVLEETFAKDTPGMHETHEPDAATEEKPTGQGEQDVSPEAAYVPAAQAAHVSVVPLVLCA